MTRSKTSPEITRVGRQARIVAILSSSSISSDGSALTTFMRCPATWQRIRCSWNNGTVISCANRPG